MKKKLLLLGLMVVAFIMGYVSYTMTTSTRTTEYWKYNDESGEMELVDTKVEEIEGIFDEKVKITYKVQSYFIQ